MTPLVAEIKRGLGLIKPIYAIASPKMLLGTRHNITKQRSNTDHKSRVRATHLLHTSVSFPATICGISTDELEDLWIEEDTPARE